MLEQEKNEEVLRSLKKFVAEEKEYELLKNDIYNKESNHRKQREIFNEKKVLIKKIGISIGIAKDELENINDEKKTK